MLTKRVSRLPIHCSTAREEKPLFRPHLKIEIMKNRIERINQLIQEKIAGIISRDIFVEGALITVQAVDTSKDLKYAKIKVSIMPFKDSLRAMKILQSQAVMIQDKLNSSVKIKFVPRIKFYLDKSEELAGRIDKILKNISK